MRSCMNCRHAMLDTWTEPCASCMAITGGGDYMWEPQPEPYPTAPIVEFFNDVNEHFTHNTKEDSK